MTASEAERICGQLYGCRIDLKELRSFENIVFSVRLEDGRPARILKAPRHEKGHDAILREQQIVRGLASHDIPVPRIEFTQDDLPDTLAPFTAMQKSAGAPLNRLFAADRPRALPCLKEAGRILARLGRIAPGDVPSAASPTFRRDQDLKRWRTIRERADQFGHLDENNRSLLDATMVCLDMPPAEMVHGDYAMVQMLVEDGRIQCVVDWGGAGCGHALHDLAYFIAHSKYYEGSGDDAQAIVKGFEEARPLDEKSARILRLFIAYELLWQATFYVRGNRPDDIKRAERAWNMLAAEPGATRAFHAAALREIR